MRIGALALMALALATSAAPRGMAASKGLYDPNQSYTYRILNNPTTGDAFMFRGALQQTAQNRSNAIFNALVSLLGGTAPAINFVPTGSQFLTTATGDGHLSANGGIDRPGAPIGTINLDPYATEGLINNKAPTHDGALVGMPHEMSHLRQTAAVLGDIPTREGGAQAFADLVALTAANRAKIPNTLAQEPAGQFDGVYSDFVKQAQARGNQWLLAGQFGNTGTPAWP